MFFMLDVKVLLELLAAIILFFVSCWQYADRLWSQMGGGGELSPFASFNVYNAQLYNMSNKELFLSQQNLKENFQTVADLEIV